jgi:Spy/CpxP family protein refolding chaperone
MKKTTYTIILVALAMVASMAAFAQRGPGGAGPKGPGAGSGEWPNARIIDHLGLDAAQIAAWTADHEAFRAKVAPLHETMADLHAKLREAVDAPDADATAVGTLMLEIKAIRTEIQAARTVLDEKLKSVLTPEQIAKFDAFRAARGNMGRGGRGKGGGFGQGSGNGYGTGQGRGSGFGYGPGTCK